MTKLSQQLYLTLCLLGLVLPYASFIPFLISDGLNINLMLQQLFANRISSFFGWDVIVSALVTLTFIGIESQQNKLKWPWLALLGTLIVGPSFGLPLFLYLRQKQMISIKGTATRKGPV
jgi:hypothetical protein